MKTCGDYESLCGVIKIGSCPGQHPYTSQLHMHVKRKAIEMFDLIVPKKRTYQYYNTEAVFDILTVGMAVAMLATMAALAPATTPSVGAKEEIDHHFQLFFI